LVTISFERVIQTQQQLVWQVDLFRRAGMRNLYKYFASFAIEAQIRRQAQLQSTSVLLKGLVDHAPLLVITIDDHIVRMAKCDSHQHQGDTDHNEQWSKQKPEPDLAIPGCYIFMCFHIKSARQ